MVVIANVVLSLLGCFAGYSMDMTQRQQSRQLLQKEDEICEPLFNRGCEKFYSEDYPSPLSAGHKCEDYIQRERRDESAVLSLIEKDLVQYPDLWKKISGSQKFMYHIKGPNPGQEFLICTVTKTGSTRLRLFLMRIQGIHAKMQNRQMWNQTFLQLLPVSQQMSILKDRNIKRIRMVRNPYIRAASMYYTSKMVRFGSKISFDDWVASLYYNKTHAQHVVAYNLPQQDFCWGNLGFQFDYILKVERQNFWFPCFIENFNLWKYFMRGWNASDQCYLSTPDVPCNGPYQNEDGKLIYPSDDDRFYGDGVHVAHNSNSANKYKELYKNQSTAIKVTELFLDDIVNYNYPFYSQMV